MIKKINKKQSGFTLVELLVVVAIIGLLSTIVLVGFGDIRSEARDAAIKANMAQMRLAAEVEYNAENSYAAVEGNTDFAAALAAAEAAGDTCTVEVAADAFCIECPLASSGDWCIDSTGYMGTTANCDAVNNDCAADA